MITAKDIRKYSGVHLEIFDDFIKEYVIPKFKETYTDTVTVWYNEWTTNFNDYNSGLLQAALEYRGFKVDRDRSLQCLYITIPPQEE